VKLLSFWETRHAEIFSIILSLAGTDEVIGINMLHWSELTTVDLVMLLLYFIFGFALL
jgi:hypothetical protein